MVKLAIIHLRRTDIMVWSLTLFMVKLGIINLRQTDILVWRTIRQLYSESQSMCTHACTDIYIHTKRDKYHPAQQQLYATCVCMHMCTYIHMYLPIQTASSPLMTSWHTYVYICIHTQTDKYHPAQQQLYAICVCMHMCTYIHIYLPYLQTAYIQNSQEATYIHACIHTYDVLVGFPPLPGCWRPFLWALNTCTCRR
jgi:hypothetical protein